MSNVPKDCSNYSNFFKFGRSVYGTVYRSKDKRNGAIVVIKEILKKKFDNPKEITQKKK